MKGSGFWGLILGRDAVSNFGLMVRDMRVTLKGVHNLASADLYTPMVMFMKASGCLTRHTDRVSISTPRMEEASILAHGFKTSNMVKAKKSGLMVQYMLAALFRGGSKGPATSNGLTETAIKENFKITKSTARAPTFGATDASTKGSGSTTKWKESVSSSGQTDGAIVVATRLTSSQVRESSSGRLASTTMAVG